MKKAVILLSGGLDSTTSAQARAKERKIVFLAGGLDSTTTLAIAQDEGFTLYGLTFRYGQRHQFEIAVSQKIAQVYNLADHIITEINLRAFGGSALVPFSSIV